MLKDVCGVWWGNDEAYFSHSYVSIWSFILTVAVVMWQQFCTHQWTYKWTHRFNLSTVGKQAFPVSGANFWNSLPSRVTSAPSLAIFRQHIKTFLFRLSSVGPCHLICCTALFNCGSCNNVCYLGHTKKSRWWWLFCGFCGYRFIALITRF